MRKENLTLKPSHHSCLNVLYNSLGNQRHIINAYYALFLKGLGPSHFFSAYMFLAGRSTSVLFKAIKNKESGI